MKVGAVVAVRFLAPYVTLKTREIAIKTMSSKQYMLLLSGIRSLTAYYSSYIAFLRKILHRVGPTSTVAVTNIGNE